MHHGTHEKQLSNVFAWLLDPDGTHKLGDVGQRLFVELVHTRLPEDIDLPTTGYSVTQEVNTSGLRDDQDMADIVITRPDARIVIENFHSSDGHGHDYAKYLTHAREDERRGVVVLFSALREVHRITHGWEQAISIPYGEALEPLRNHLEKNPRWGAENSQQQFFIHQLFYQFSEGPEAVNLDDRIKFMTAMCETGEAIRYSKKNHEGSAEQFAADMALHAQHQFEDGRGLLRQVKSALRDHAKSVIVPGLHGPHSDLPSPTVSTQGVGVWEWSVNFEHSEIPAVYLQFGPTISTKYAQWGISSPPPNFEKIYAGRRDTRRYLETDVTMKEVVEGLSADDHRLLDALVGLLNESGAAIN